MFKSLKRKGEKIKDKVDFKFGFQATKVPLSGWDKLWVSVIPIETGRVSAKTTRAIAKSGNCQWSDAVTESIKLSRDSKTDEYEEKLYKFVVSTGASRSGVLGEATINVALYAKSGNSTQIALSLKNCSHGTILNTTITCLTPKTTSSGRDLDTTPSTERNEVALDEDEALSITDDDLDDSDLSDNHTAGSITSNASSAALNSATPKKVLQGNNGSYNRTPKDASGVRRHSNEGLYPGGPKGGSQNGSVRSITSDVSVSSSVNSGSGMQDMGSSKVESGLGRQEKDWDRERTVHRTSSTDSTHNAGSAFPASVRTSVVSTSNGPSSSSIHKGVWQDPHGRPKDRGEWPTSQRSRGTSENGSRVTARTSVGGVETLQADLTLAEATIEELKQETAAAARQKSKLTLEIDTLTQQLRARKRDGEERRIEITTLQAERDRLKQELEQFRSSKLALEERENGEGNARWKTENAQRALRELEEETKYQKEQNMHLNMQLSKTQDSNMELMLAIKDLEEALDQEKKKTEEMTLSSSELKDHHRREQNVAHTQIEEDLRARVFDLEQGKKSLEAQVLSLRSARFSATSDDEHVTKLEKMTEQLTRDVEELEKESRELADENVELSLNVETLNKDVESKNVRIAQLEQEVRKASESHLDARAVSGKSAEISSLRNQVRGLEMKLSASEDAQSSHLKRNKGHVEEIQTLMEELRTANTRLEKRLKSSEEEASFATIQLEETKVELANVQTARDDFERQKKEIGDRYGGEKETLERSLAEAREAFAAQEREIRSIEETATRAEEERNIALGKIIGLEDDISRLKAETRSIIEAKSSGEDLAGKLRLQKEEVEELKRNAEAECISLRQHLMEREAEVTKMRQETTVHVAQCKEFEARITQLEGQKSELESSVEDLHETERASKLHAHELESRFAVVSDEMESVISSKKELEKCVSHSELQMKELQNQRNELEASLQSIEEDGKAGKEQVELLEAELRSLQSQMDTQTSSRRNLERRASELESTKDDLYNQLADMEEENLKHTERIADLGALLRSATEERERHKLERELLEARSLDHHNEKQKSETILLTLGRDHQQKVSDLETKVANLMVERNKYENSRKEQERLVQDLQRNAATSSDAVKAMEDRIHNMEAEKSALEGRLLQMSETHDVASKSVASLEAEMSVLRADNDKHAAALQLDLENLEQSRGEYEQRAKQAEESLRRVRWEKAAAVERLQVEVQRLTEQMTSTNDEREKLASQALVEASELRAERGDWEERLRQAEQKVKEADAGCSSLKAEYISRLQDLANQNEASKSRERDVAVKLSESLRDIEGLKVKEEISRSQAEELDRKLVVALRERENLEGELDDLKLRVQDSEMLGFEIQRMQNSLRQIKVERDSFNDSAKNLKVLNEYLEQEKTRLEDDITAFGKENEDLKQAKVAVEEKLRRLQLQLESQGSARSVEAEQRSESMKLRRQNSEFKRKLTEHEEEKEEFRRKVQLLEDKLKERSETLGMVEKRLKDHDENGKSTSNVSPSSFPQSPISRTISKGNSTTGSPTQDSRELNEMREKVKQLEVVLESKSTALDNLKRDYIAKESILYKKIELLEGANEQLVQGGPDLGMDQLQLELTRLQNLNATLARRERELVSQLGMQEVLHKEVQRLQEENERMENRLIRFKETAKFGNIMEKVITLETELAEAMESNSMYKLQLRNAFSKQHNVQAAALHDFGDVDQIISDVVRLRKAASKSEEDVKDLRERYATMSVRYAEVSAQKEELVFTLRNLRNGKKSFNGRSDV